jgi:hypothetical protein
LASGDFSAEQCQVYFNGGVHEQGLVAVALCGDVTLETVVSQGCTPIGESWTITRADRNFILGIGNRPAYSVLMETFDGLSLEDRKKSQNNLFVGLAIDEYREELHCGDFLVRNLLGGDPKNGALAVGGLPAHRTNSPVPATRLGDSRRRTVGPAGTIAHTVGRTPDLRGMPDRLQWPRIPALWRPKPRRGPCARATGQHCHHRVFRARRVGASRPPKFPARLHGLARTLRTQVDDSPEINKSGPHSSAHASSPLETSPRVATTAPLLPLFASICCLSRFLNERRTTTPV